MRRRLHITRVFSSHMSRQWLVDWYPADMSKWADFRLSYTYRPSLWCWICPKKMLVLQKQRRKNNKREKKKLTTEQKHRNRLRWRQPNKSAICWSFSLVGNNKTRVENSWMGDRSHKTTQLGIAVFLSVQEKRTITTEQSEKIHFRYILICSSQS